MIFEEKVETGVTMAIGAAGGLAIEWQAIAGSLINAALIGLVGGFFGLLGKYLFNKLVGRTSKPRKGEENDTKIE